ncbi:MCE family protein [Streptomyces sp. A7024]|uniref:MCE family protein n=1 Tax=Streptomyces coryli TaxID=1128680 RepID=A0A6G4U419_9ACTN|nr:MCE family protein [Streptomyces coryli]NGN65971.1 MCE family protein [Streptomyces coryli]
MSARKSLTGPLVKSAIFVLVTAIATTVLAFSVANTGVGSTRSYKAWFTDTTGLIVGDSVRVAGVQVGQVASIEVVQRRYAQVTFEVEKNRGLPASTTASIKYLNMVGQRYVDLQRGTGPLDQQLPAGGTIPLKRTEPALDLTELFNGFQPLMQGLSPADTNKLAASIVQVLQGEGTTVTSLIDTVGSLTTTLAKKDKAIGKVIDNLTKVLKTVNKRQTEFTELIGTLEELVRGFAGDRKPIGEAIGSMGKLATATSGLFKDGRKPIKDNIREVGRLSENLNDDAPLLENALKKTPAKMAAIGRTASYGSWLNLYLCQAKVSGAETYGGGKPPTGIGLKGGRCRS